jgi:hypothetical protein
VGVLRAAVSMAHSSFSAVGAQGCRLARALAVATLLAGCGEAASSSNGLTLETPAQIVAAARSAAVSAATVHVAGSILDGGTPISFDMELVSGKGGEGRIVLEGLSVELVNVDNSVYINSGATFYSRFAGAAAARRLEGKWLKGSARGVALGPLTSLTNLGKLLGKTLSAHGSLSRGPGTTVAGNKAIVVRDLEKRGTLYVAGTGTPYPLEIVQHGARRGRLVFNKWNQPVSLEPPANAINIKQLQEH